MKERVESILNKALGANTAVQVTISDKKEFGHYSTNVALRLAKEKGKNPLDVAKEITEEIKKKTPKGLFEKIEVAPPGFINFWLSPNTLHKELLAIHNEKTEYGFKNLGKKKKVQVEFVSANPTGPLTLANGRGGFLGDVLSNLLSDFGYDVEREYYVNDSGNQVLTLGKSILAAAGFINDEETFYKGEYVKEWAESHAEEIKKSNQLAGPLGKKAADFFLKLIKKDLEKAGIKFTRFTSEKNNIYTKDYHQQALKLFNKNHFTYESEDGALWLKTTEFDDDKDRVLIKSDKSPTYFLADAGHYLESKKRGYDEKILILGPDHYGYVKRIQAVASILKFKKSEVIVTQAVRLIKDGKEVKMSKRKGEFVTFIELIDEVGADVARFFFLSVSPNSHMDFDLALAKERSTKNPVYYVQYAYVRCLGILAKARGKSKALSPKTLDMLNTKEDLELISVLSRFGEVAEEGVRKLEVHHLTRYAMELARAFHNFYEKEHIVGEEKKIAEARLALVYGSKIIFENLFDLLGISKPKKM